MEINNDTLRSILRQTTCDWTRGYLSCLIESVAPSRSQIAAELMDSCGPDRKIDAIKLIRNNYGLMLKEAKDLVDEYFRSGNVIGLPDDPCDPGSSACVVG